MVTTIQISNKLKEVLNKRKLFDRETYEEVIWDVLEDSIELSNEAKKQIKLAEADVKAGRVFSHNDVKRELGL